MDAGVLVWMAVDNFIAALVSVFALEKILVAFYKLERQSVYSG